MSVKFHIVIPGYNCGALVDKCIESLRRQTYQPYSIMAVDDASTDDTLNRLKAHCVPFIKNERNMGAAYSRYMATKVAETDTVICHLDMDDELREDALELVAERYEQGAAMTYGNWINDEGLVCPVPLEYSDEVHARKGYRKDVYRATAFRTFFKVLWDRIPLDRHMVNGRWPMSDTESETMFSCLEMAGKEGISVINEPIYLYKNRGKNKSVHRFGRVYQDEMYRIVTSRKPICEY